MTHIGPRRAAPMPGEARGPGGPAYRVRRPGPAAEAHATCSKVSPGAAWFPPAASQVTDDPGREE
jgi:hypothetical protein